MGMPVGDSDGGANCSCRFSLTSKGMWFVSCLLDLDRAVVPHHTYARPHPLVRAASATPLLDRVGQTLRFQVFFFSCGLGMRDPSPPAVISLLASRIPCFQGADSQFNPPVRCAQAVFVRVHSRCHPAWCAEPRTSALCPCTCGVGQWLLGPNKHAWGFRKCSASV